MKIVDKGEAMLSEKKYSIQMITSFLYEVAKKNEVYKFTQDDITYLALKNIHDESELQLIIIPSTWIQGKKIRNWLADYLVLTNNFKMNSVAIEKFNKNFTPNNEKSNLEIQIIDFTLEEKNVFDKIFLQPKKAKIWSALYDEYLSHKYLIVDKKKSDLIEKYKMLFQKEIFKVNKTKKVCVVSPFTYGKSALINSLLGRKILAEDILVKTAKVTTINYNAQFWLMKEGNQLFVEKYKEIGNFKSRLGYLTTINENQGHVINVTLDNPTLKNITLIDTPGLFGKFSQHDEITESIIKDVDQIIYLLSPTQLGFEPYTRKIIEWQKKYNKPCIFVMNKIDLVKEEKDRQRLMEEFNEKMGHLVAHDGIFLVSAYSGLKSRLYKNAEVDLITLKKDMLISIKKNGEVYSGRNFTEDCVEILEKESGILELESYLNSMYGG